MKMKFLKTTTQSLLIHKHFNNPLKYFKNIYPSPQIHASFNAHLHNPTIYGLKTSFDPKKTNLDNTHLHYPTIYGLKTCLDPKKSNLDNIHLHKSTISTVKTCFNPKKINLGSTQLHNPTIYGLKTCLDPKKSNLGNTQLLNSSFSDLNSKNTYFSNTQIATLSKNQYNPIMKSFLKRYCLTHMFSLSNFSKLIGKTTPYQVRLFSEKPSDDDENSQPIDASSSIRKPISLWPGMYHSPVTNALWEARSSIFERVSGNAGDVPVQSELITKTPSQSRTSILYRFSSDYVLFEQYRNPWNEIRMGKLVEDLDALAGTISYKHCCNNDGTTRSILLVTASVDKIVLKKPIRVDADLTITGAVTWVGRSSMELQLEVTQPTGESLDDSSSVALIANFTFVARDSNSGKSALVNRIQPETNRESMLWEEAEERNKVRKQKRVEQQKKEIDDEETDRLNKLLAEGRVFCDMPALADRDSILIKDTCLQNSLICQPQQRNIHGRIFGGFLMRRAFELAFATAYTFAGSAPCFLEVDHVDFLRPVDVGDFLRLKSCVLYTELENPNRPLINIEVVAHVTRPEYRSSEISNKFYFTFTVHSEAVLNGLKIRNVVPATEEEARRVIERIDAETS